MPNSKSPFEVLRKNIFLKTGSLLLAIFIFFLFKELAYAASLTISGTLTENTLNGATIDITLTDDTFVDATLQSGNFVLINSPSGLSINNVTYNSSTSATLTLGFNNTDFDTNISNFSILISATEVTSNTSLSSNNLPITAVVEAVPALTIAGSLTESNLNTTSVSLSLANTAFKDGTLDKTNFTLNNAPSGTIVSTVSYGNANSATIGFSFNNTDFDTNISNFNITINGAELTSNANLTSNNLPITAIQEAPSATISGSLSESSLNGAALALSLASDTFKDTTLDKANFTLSNAPSGTTISNVTYVNSSAANITLAFNGTDFDTNVTNFSVIVGGTELTSNASVISNALTIAAIQESADTTKPTLSNITVDNTFSTATLVFSENIDRATSSLSTLRDKIQFTADGTTYTALNSADTISDLNGSTNTLTITFNTKVSGTKNRIKIASDAVKDAAGNKNSEIISSSFSALDTERPYLQSAVMDSTHKIVTLVFQENISKLQDAATLKSKIQLTKDGTTFAPLLSGDTLADVNGDGKTITISLGNALSGTKNRIKILAGAVQDTEGNQNIDLLSNYLAEGTVTVAISDMSIDSTKKVVTILFDQSIHKIDTLATLKSKIQIAPDGVTFTGLKENDTVLDIPNPTKSLVITFSDPLVGEKNKVRILAGAVQNASNVKNEQLTTAAISGKNADTAGPVIQDIALSLSSKKIRVTFNENVKNPDPLADLKSKIMLSSDGTTFRALTTSESVLELDGTGNTLVITLQTPLSGAKNKLRILAGAIQDSAGNKNDLLDSATFAGIPESLPFSDVQNHWAWEFIAKIYQLGIAKGRTASSYAPDANLNRAELVQLVINAFHIPLAQNVTSNPFVDVDIHAWYGVIISTIKKLGIVNGYENGLYSPEKEISRVEALKIIFEAAGLTLPDEEVTFTDTAKGAWYQKYIAFAKNRGIVQGYSDGSFRPSNFVTRAEIAKMLLLTLEEKAGQS